MVCNELLGSVVVQGTPFKASNDAICGIVDLVHGYCALVASSCQDGGFVHQVFQIGTAEASSSLGNVRQGDSLQPAGAWLERVPVSREWAETTQVFRFIANAVCMCM